MVHRDDDKEDMEKVHGDHYTLLDVDTLFFNVYFDLFYNENDETTCGEEY